MKIKLKIGLSGSVDGIAYPPPGVVFEVPDNVGADLCASGFAVPVKSEPKVEKAVPPVEDVEMREESSGLTKASMAPDPPPATPGLGRPETKRGPGRPRKARG